MSERIELLKKLECFNCRKEINFINDLQIFYRKKDKKDFCLKCALIHHENICRMYVN